VKLKRSFWRFAHRRYQIAKPGVLAEVAAFVWFGFFASVYAGAILAGWRAGFLQALVGLVLTVTPFAIGMAHRRIRIERAKGPDALYRKRSEYGG
jgi:hypothetical protein